MSVIYDTEQLDDRARNLAASLHNGMARGFVTLDTTATPPSALLDVEFHNPQWLSEIVDQVTNHGVAPTALLRVHGGTRICGGENPGQIQVTQVAAGADDVTLRLTLQPIGDYSTYRLGLVLSHGVLHGRFDPLFATLAFKFRPGCFNTNCAPARSYSVAPTQPVIDYLARDFDSFKHLLINAMRVRVPDWEPTSEADLDQVLIDLLAADADDLCDYQDRVLNEAYFGQARKRVSLARHARLMDYHIHQGNQASTWVAVQVSADTLIHAPGKPFGVWTGVHWQDDDAVIFAASAAQQCYRDLNQLELYTWSGAVTALEVGSTSADLMSRDGTDLMDAQSLLDLLQGGNVTALVIEEKLNPQTGRVNGRDVSARQRLRLLGAELAEDPVSSAWSVRVHWREEDRLTRRYCFLTQCDGTWVSGVSTFHGNLVQVSHGRPHVTTFRPAGADLGAAVADALVYRDEAHYEDAGRWGTLCRLPAAQLAYRNTIPGGDLAPVSSLSVTVSGYAAPWEEQIDLIESESDDTDFIVETDEMGWSTLRFGNNVNALALAQDAVVTCRYQTGRGSAGNVGADTLTGFDASAAAYPTVSAVWNPLDVTDGRDPEPVCEILRRAPQAYRARQLRAVTLEDYHQRAEQLAEVAHARARYAWTGSWRTVRVAIDPKAGVTWDEALRAKIARHLDAVRLIGEDLEVRQARYVGLDILLRLCAHPDYWIEDLEQELAVAFSDGYTADGRRGLFHPDNWTFGQPLHASQLIGCALSVSGVERVLLTSIRRWSAGSGANAPVVVIEADELPLDNVAQLAVEPFEVIQVANDPNRLEDGRIRFDIIGGRQ